MDKTHEVINIYRAYGAENSFTLTLWADGALNYVKVDPSLSLKISQGLIFVGDSIRITARTPAGIIFEAVHTAAPDISRPHSESQYSESRVKDEDSLLLSESSTKDQRYLPFLCDVLPYHRTAVEAVKAVPVYKDGTFQGKYAIDGVEITNIKLPLPAQFIAKIHQKTRINMYPNTYNPFFFIIVCSNSILLKVVFWRESLRKYSSLRVGEIIYIKEYKNKKKLPFIDRVEYNTFTESVYFDCEEITAREIVKIEASKRGTIQRRFETVEGRVQYLSVLLRYVCNSCIMEYVLCRVDGCCVVLFYNSDDEFGRIKEGCRARIAELRKTTRAGFEFYLSTIYTQFEILEERDDGPRDSDSGALQEVDQGPPGPLTQPHKRPNPGSREPNKRVEGRETFGAVGFLPDYFASTSEILDYGAVEVIHGREVSVNLFMKPHVGTLDDIRRVFLLLNESKKHIVSSVLVGVADDELSIDYLENGRVERQPAKKVILEDGFECYYIENFFEGEARSYMPSPSQVASQRVYFVIESFRADLETVLHYITGIIEK